METAKQTPLQPQALNDDTFIAQFENQTLLLAHFNHIGHLRLAWLYLERYPLEQAINRVCGGIKVYAKSLGASSKFHFTITDAIVRIMFVRMQAQTYWLAFLDDNTDLVENAKAVVGQYYSQAVLGSEQARLRVIEPDIKAIVTLLPL